MHIQQEEDQAKGEEALKVFSEAGQEADVNVIKILKKGDIVSTIIESAEKEAVNLIIMGASQGKVVSEWVSAGVMEKTNIPVVVIPHEFSKDVGR